MKKGLGMRIGAIGIALILCFVSPGVPAYAYEQEGISTSRGAVAIAQEEVSQTPTDTTTDKPGNVTLDFKDADILLVLRLLSLKSGVNIVAGPEVSGTVTIRLHDVPWEKALDVVLRTYGYVYERDENIVRVTTRENLAAEELVTETFVLNYSTAAEIEEAITEIISERGRIKSVPRTNTVIVTDVATNIYKISEIIKRLDKRTPQVFIDAKVIETSQENLENVGIEWSQEVFDVDGSSRAFSFPWKTREDTWWKSFFPDENITAGTLDQSEFTATLNLLKSFATTKVVSNPRIVVLSNQTAKVQVGEEVGIPTFERNESTGSFEVTGFESRDVGVVLNVTPHVNDANEILVDLKPEVSTFDGFTDIGTTNLAFPQFSTTEAETQVLIRDGETIAIGGLLEDAYEETVAKVPLLSDIPLVGRLFTSKRQDDTANQKTETLFFITCTIVDTEGQPEFAEF